MTSDRKPEFDPNTQPDFAAAYRELFAGVQPSEQLLAATRRLYTRPRRQRWPAAAACCAAACLLLAFGLQLWPQPADVAPPENNMQLRMAAETQADEYPAPSGKSRIAAEQASEQSAEPDVEEYSLALLSENAPEKYAYSPDDDCINQNIAIFEPLHIAQPLNIAQIVLRSIKWLVLW